MHMRQLHPRPRFVAIAISIAMLLLLALPAVTSAHSLSGSETFYTQTNLVSDLAGVAQFTDSNLVNPWGLVHGPTSPWWVSDNGAGVSTLYKGDGSAIPLVVTIPPPAGSPAGTTAAPTGVVFNPFNSTDSDDFVVSENGVSGPAFFIFATEDGTISGWNPTVDLNNAILMADNSTVGPGAVYKGLAIGSADSHEFLYASNFRAGTIDVFDANFTQVSLEGSFKDPKIPDGYAPFNITNLGGQLYVTYAKQNAQKHDDVAGPGHGFVDVFDTEGHLLQRLVTRGKLDSPWGLALAPSDFGRFSNDLLVGNFGDGFINAYDPNTGAFLGQLEDPTDTPIHIDGLWALAFGNGAVAGATNQLFFTAGINGEKDGLFGVIDSQS